MSTPRKRRPPPPPTGPRVVGYYVSKLPDAGVPRRYLSPFIQWVPFPWLFSSRRVAEAAAIAGGALETSAVVQIEEVSRDRQRVLGGRDTLPGIATGDESSRVVDNLRAEHLRELAKARSARERARALAAEKRRHVALEKIRAKREKREARALAAEEKRQRAAARVAKGARVAVPRSKGVPHLAAREGPPGYQLPLGFVAGAELPAVAAHKPLEAKHLIDLYATAGDGSREPDVRGASGGRMVLEIEGAIRRTVQREPWAAWCVRTDRVLVSKPQGAPRAAVSLDTVGWGFAVGPGPRITDDARPWGVLAVQEYTSEINAAIRGRTITKDWTALVTDGERVTAVNALTLAKILAAIPAAAVRMHPPRIVAGRRMVSVIVGADVVAVLMTIDGHEWPPPPRAKRAASKSKKGKG